VSYIGCLDVLEQRKLVSYDKKTKKDGSHSETVTPGTDNEPVVVGRSDIFEDLYSCSSSSEDDDEE